MIFSIESLYDYIENEKNCNIGFMNFNVELMKLVSKLPEKERTYLENKINLVKDQPLGSIIEIPDTEIEMYLKSVKQLSKEIILQYGTADIKTMFDEDNEK